MNIDLFYDNVLVSELQDDLIINGVVTRYDPDSPFMFCKVLKLSDEAEDFLDYTDIVVIKRYAKEEYLTGTYFISLKDIRGKMSIEEYKSIKEG